MEGTKKGDNLMGDNTKIEWADATFSPWWGCSKVSQACKNCYAEAFAKTRLGFDIWSQQDGDGERRTFGDDHWRKPIHWDKQAGLLGVRRRVFCASMADVFEDHPVANEQRLKLWKLIHATPRLDWQLLTKRPQNIEHMLPDDWGQGWPNVWLGTTAENQHWADIRIPQLLQIPAVIHFVSCEPLLGEIDLRNVAPDELGQTYDALSGTWSGNADTGGPKLAWAITGGESGPHARPIDLDAAKLLRQQCRLAGVAYFFKQMGGRGARSTWAPIPEVLQVKEFPTSPAARSAADCARPAAG